MLLPLRGLSTAVAVTCVPSGRTAAFSSARGGRGATDQVPEEPAAGSRQAPPAGASRAGGEGRVALRSPYPAREIEAIEHRDGFSNYAVRGVCSNYLCKIVS